MWELQQFYYNYAFLASQGGYIFGDNGMNSEDLGLNNEGAQKGGEFLKTLKSEVLPLKMGDVNYDIKKDCSPAANWLWTLTVLGRLPTIAMQVLISVLHRSRRSMASR